MTKRKLKQTETVSPFLWKGKPSIFTTSKGAHHYTRKTPGPKPKTSQVITYFPENEKA
jgi:hypothetical protein